MKRQLSDDRQELLRRDDLRGLTRAEADQRRLRFGSNQIAERSARPISAIAGDAAKDPMLWFLAVTSAIFGLLHQYTDMAVLLVAILPLIGMDFYLHRRTEASIEGLSSVLATEAVVARDGQYLRLPATDIVPGDLVRVEAGDPFPADGVILTGGDMQAEESSLTGEAYPVPKKPLPPEATGVIPDEHWAFAGTRLLTGSALVRILFTGSEAVYGQIVRSATAAPQERTPLQQSVARVVRGLLIVAIAACLLLALVRLAQGYGLADALLSALVLAVAAIPEEFPVVLTFFLGAGVYRLARCNALVRRAVAVENVGRVSAILSDKTGTITEGRLSLHELRPWQGVDPRHLLEIGALASRARSNDPLDTVLLQAAGPAPEGYRRLVSFPFTEARRREVSLWDTPAGRLAAMKGAPETVIDLCGLAGAGRAKALAALAELSRAGQKVIACGSQSVSSKATGEPSGRFQLAGFIGIADPLRAGVREAVQAAQEAGIKVVMVTGDHPHTACAVAREAGISGDPQAVTGEMLEDRLASADPRFLASLDVVARATPAQKVMLVEAMRQSGEIVAVTGDGVNDVPALKAADVGIAMGLRGTRSAREVAAIILMDDNFRTIVRAIAEGRQLFRNLSLSFAFLLMIHIPLVSTAAIVPFLGFPILYLPIHIVVLELLIHPAAILGFQQAARTSLDPGERGAGFFSRREVTIIVATGLCVMGTILLLFIGTVQGGETAEHARAMAIVALIASLGTQLAILTKLKETPARTISAIAFLAALLLVQVPFLAQWAHMHTLPALDWLAAAAAGMASSLPSILYGRARTAGHSPV